MTKKKKAEKSLKGLSKENELNKLGYLHTMEYFIVVKTNEVGLYVQLWKELQDICISYLLSQ